MSRMMTKKRDYALLVSDFRRYKAFFESLGEVEGVEEMLKITDRSLKKYNERLLSECKRYPEERLTSEILKDWLAKNSARERRSRNHLGYCLHDKDSEWYIYTRDVLAIYREGKVRTGFTPEHHRDFTILSAAVDKFDRECNKVLQLPSHAELEAFIQVSISRKEVGRLIYDLGEGLPKVDAYLLMDMLDLFPEARTARYKDHRSPLYFYSVARHDAILFPAHDLTL